MIISSIVHRELRLYSHGRTPAQVPANHLCMRKDPGKRPIGLPPAEIQATNTNMGGRSRKLQCKSVLPILVSSWKLNSEFRGIRVAALVEDDYFIKGPEAFQLPSFARTNVTVSIAVFFVGE